MFSFHKPKVYRSTQGCCICKAKSSSSRFTDSKKYETDFIECFQLSTPRKGEICNACVLLVKRFKRLPPGSERHWGHVVDARVGPGLKSMTKFKKRKEEQMLQQQNGNGKVSNPTLLNSNVKTLTSVSERFGKIFKKTKKKKLLEVEKRDPSPSSDDNSSPSSPNSNQSDSENINMAYDMYDELDNEKFNRPSERTHKKYQRKSYRPLKNRGHIKASVIDEQFWMPLKTCCGVVYENKMIGALLVDSTLTEVCPLHRRVSRETNGDAHSNGNHMDDKFNSQRSELYDNNTAIKTTSNVDSSTNALQLTQLESAHQIEIADTTSIRNNYKLSKLAQSSNETNTKAFNYLHKIKSDSGKIVKNSINKLPSKIKSTDLNIVKNLVKYCHEKTAKVAPMTDKLSGGINNEKLNEVLGTKMNENSSDSGYDETSNLQELQQKSRAIRPVILANGIKLHVQQKNLVLAANLAGISPLHTKVLGELLEMAETCNTLTFNHAAID